MTNRSAAPEPAAPHDVSVVHEDEWCVVVHKPPGLLCVPGRGADKQDCLLHRIHITHSQALIVHRLDMATSGLCLMALGPAMQRAFSIAFAQRQVHKRYVAMVAGRITAPDAADGWGVIDLPLAADWPNRPRQVVDRQRGKPSVTRSFGCTFRRWATPSSETRFTRRRRHVTQPRASCCMPPNLASRARAPGRR
jgi:23S rRNA-/tRNA-specific pseudouridylate synthase